MSENVSEVIAELVDLLAGGKNDLAESADVSYASLHAWSTGRRTPTRENVRRLADLARRRAARIGRLADALERYGRTGKISVADAEDAPDRARHDPERLAEIRERSHMIVDQARSTMEWIREQQEELEIKRQPGGGDESGKGRRPAPRGDPGAGDGADPDVEADPGDEDRVA